MIDFGKLQCTLGRHLIVTTREGKPPASVKRGVPAGAAAHIHTFCARPDCTHHVIIDTHSNTKIVPARDRA